MSDATPEHNYSTPASTLPSIFWLIPDRFDLKQDKSSWTEMANNLALLGWNVSIITSRSRQGNASLLLDAHTISVPSLDRLHLFRISTMLSSYFFLLRRSRRNDIFIMNEDMLWWLPLMRLLGRRHIHLDIRTVPLSPRHLKERLSALLFWTAPSMLFARFANSYSYITKSLQSVFEGVIGIKTPNCCIWASGVNTALFRPMPNIAPASANRFNVFYHGSIRLMRGLADLIRALKQPHAPAETHLTIVGDGPDLPHLKILVQELGLTDRVDFRGLVAYEEVPKEISQADVCICPLPDRPEWNVSSPLKVLEYMACNKPVILTPIAAHKEIAKHAPFVVWSKGHQPDQLASSIRMAYDNRHRLTVAAQDARCFVAGRFEWEVHAQTLDAHLRMVTAQPNDVSLAK